MAGASIEFTSKEVEHALSAARNGLENPAPLYRQIIEYLHTVHDRRFQTQTSPDGIPWQALSPSYQKKKHKKANKILTFRGYLSDTLAGQYDDDGVEFGTNRIYGAIHQFGGLIKNPGGKRALFFKLRGGEVGNRFVKKKKSNFAQDVTVAPYTINMPARPWLGTSADDDEHILKITKDWLQKHLAP